MNIAREPEPYSRSREASSGDEKTPQKRVVRVVPLLPNHNGPVGSEAISLLPGLIITVCRRLMAVKYQHRATPRDVANILGTLPADWPSDPQDRLSSADVVQFYLPDEVLNSFTDQHLLRRVRHRADSAIHECGTSIRLAELLLSTLHLNQAANPIFMDSFVKLMCAHVVHQGACEVGDPVHRGGLSPKQRKRAVEIVNSPSGSKATMEVMARECGLSPSHFARSFKLSFGLPVHRWIVAQQIQRAKSMLLRSDESLCAVARATGFSSQAAFNRAFAKVTGASPGRWRRYFKS